ncbi:MAG: galactose mutarotase [Treponema sp.]|jgi:aldose 1-epimerase|nr:galactose mutarotase [Treponema sp.]
MKVTRKTFGVLSNGQKVHLYTLKAGDLSFSVSTLGAAWTSLIVPSRKTGKEDVLLGFSTLAGYTGVNPYMGATIGRVGNRIGSGVFSLGGVTYRLFKNDGEHSLHGGFRGFDKRVWKAEAYEERDGIFVRFELESPDGDEGYPGKLKAAVSYGLSKANELIADYEAKVDAPCPVNMTNHSYFNLAGEGKGDILSHELTLHSSSYVEVGGSLIPTGKLLPVNGGPFDFRARKPVNRDFAAVEGGYDHCFTVDGEPGALRPCAEIREALSGRSMKISTTQPGVQFYTGNFLTGLPGKLGSVYNKHYGFCLETQHFPDSPNHPEFPSAVFGPDRDYHEQAVFSFSW